MNAVSIPVHPPPLVSLLDVSSGGCGVSAELTHRMASQGLLLPRGVCCSFLVAALLGA